MQQVHHPLIGMAFRNAVPCLAHCLHVGCKLADGEACPGHGTMTCSHQPACCRASTGADSAERRPAAGGACGSGLPRRAGDRERPAALCVLQVHPSALPQPCTPCCSGCGTHIPERRWLAKSAELTRTVAGDVAGAAHTGAAHRAAAAATDEPGSTAARAAGASSSSSPIAV
jgi:hypothetical protein